MSPLQRRWFGRFCAVSILAGALSGVGSRRIEGSPPLSNKAPLHRDDPSRDLDPVAQLEVADRALLLRRTVARAGTEDLWTWLAGPGTEDEENLLAVVFELVDRQGWQAWERALALSDPTLRELLGRHFLWAFSKRDPWQAYEEWKRHRAGFADPEWGAAAYDAALRAAAGISAAKLLEVLAEVPTKPGEPPEWLLTPEYVPGFDFEEVLDYFLQAQEQPVLASDGLLREWSRRSPEEAAAWLAANPRARETEYLLEEATGAFGNLLASGLPEPSRAATLDALKSMERQSPEFIDKVWDAAVHAAAGKITASTMAAADRMARRDTYLVGALLGTRYQESIDPSWQLLTFEEQERVLRLAEERWAAEQPSAVQARARERWHRRVTAAWEGGS
jgi:hypothetical protein